MISLKIVGALLSFFSVAVAEEEVTIEEFLQKLSTVPNVMTRKDPFTQAQPPFQAMMGTDAASASAPVLERYPTNLYSVVAVLLGDRFPRALVKLPSRESSKVVIVKESDKLGNKGGVITKIHQKGVVVVQNQRSSMGFVDKAEITLAVGVMAEEEKKR